MEDASQVYYMMFYHHIMMYYESMHNKFVRKEALYIYQGPGTESFSKMKLPNRYNR